MSHFAGQLPGRFRFQVHDLLPVPRRVVDLGASALADVAADIDDIDGVSHVDLAFVHVVQHLLRPFRPDLIVTGMTEKADTDDDVAFQGETFLGLKELLLEARAAAEGYDLVFTDHKLLVAWFITLPTQLSTSLRKSNEIIK